MEVLAGIEGLRPEHGPIFAVIGVFDGLHRGHAYLLDHLVTEARRRRARATVITFDHHPDEVLTGSAPPLLVDPEERLERLAEAGVEVTIIEHFDDAVRRTPYDAFVEAIRTRASVSGFVMTPDAAFGYERRGTPSAVAALGSRLGFDVVVVPPLLIGGRAVRSSEIRSAIAAGELDRAADLAGRPLTLRGTVSAGELRFAWPMALPPDGTYPVSVDGRVGRLIRSGAATTLDVPGLADGPVELALASS